MKWTNPGIVSCMHARTRVSKYVIKPKNIPQYFQQHRSFLCADGENLE